MISYLIKGPNKVENKIINIEGAKNACLPLLASTILFDTPVIFKHVPFSQDVITMIKLLTALGSKVKIYKEKKIIKVVNSKPHKLIVPYKLISTMRGGCLAMGPLLGKYQKKKIKVAQGGGCSLGQRSTNWHLQGFKSLGAVSSLKKGYINISTKNGLIGGKYKFPKVTVTGTSNLIMASVLASKTSYFYNISLEPEVIDLINFLKKSGAKIKFTGNRSIKIEGVKSLMGQEHRVISDRIEAFSYLCIGAITKGSITVKGINPSFLKTELKILKKIGYYIEAKKSSITLKSFKNLKSTNFKTGPFPSYVATDCMPMLLAVLTQVPGVSRIEENIFGAHRFQCVPELQRLGAKIEVDGNKAKIFGPSSLSSSECISSDLRTTFSIILGLIIAKGNGRISRVYHGERGYFNLFKKLKKIGIKIKSQSF